MGERVLYYLFIGIIPQIVIFVETKRKFLHVHARAGGVITLWKSVLITVKVEIGGTTAQIELRGVEDKNRLDLVAKAVF